MLRMCVCMLFCFIFQFLCSWETFEQTKAVGTLLPECCEEHASIKSYTGGWHMGTVHMPASLPAYLPAHSLPVLYRPVWGIRLLDAQHFLPSLSAALCRRCVTYCVLHDSSRCPVQQRGRFGDAARGREPFLEGGLPPASIVGAEVGRTKTCLQTGI